MALQPVAALFEIFGIERQRLSFSGPLAQRLLQGLLDLDLAQPELAQQQRHANPQNRQRPNPQKVGE